MVAKRGTKALKKTGKRIKNLPVKAKGVKGGAADIFVKLDGTGESQGPQQQAELMRPFMLRPNRKP